MEVFGVVPSHLIKDDKTIDSGHAEVFQCLFLILLRLHLFGHELSESSHCALTDRGHVPKLVITLSDHLVQPDAILFNLLFLNAVILTLMATIPIF